MFLKLLKKPKPPLSKEMREVLEYLIEADDAVRGVKYSAGYTFTANFFLAMRKRFDKIKEQLKDG
jgi:hypothetical protein